MFTKQNREEDAALVRAEEQEKMRLEQIFLRDIRRLFIRMNRANSESIAGTGSNIVANRFKPEWEAILDNHYSRVQNAFQNNVRLRLPEGERELSDEEIALLIAAYISWREERRQSSAQIITDTNQRQLNNAIDMARQTMIEQDQEITNMGLAATTAVIFRRAYEARTNVIAITETQAAAESTKLQESAVLSGEDPSSITRLGGLFIASKSIKIWNTVGDILVRPIHAAVNLTDVSINEAFTIGGERLMFPGDTSLGATAKNVAHCRCGLTYRINRVRRAA